MTFLLGGRSTSDRVRRKPKDRKKSQAPTGADLRVLFVLTQTPKLAAAFAARFKQPDFVRPNSRQSNQQVTSSKCQFFRKFGQLWLNLAQDAVLGRDSRETKSPEGTTGPCEHLKVFRGDGEMKTPDAKARIVMVTNYDQADLREAALQAGAYAFVAKDNLFRLVHLLEREQP
jgi:hypothetical protein